MRKASIIIISISLMLVLIFGNQSIRYSEQALTIWFENLVPSMFISMVLIRTLYKQHVLSYVCPSWFCRLFHINKQAMSLVISSMLIGFPNGSVLINEALANDEIQPACAKRLSLICCFPAPGFVILTCGVTLFHSVAIGVFLFLSQILSGLILLFITRPNVCMAEALTHKASASCVSDLTASIKESGISLFMIGGYLMLFMTISGLLFSFLPEMISTPLRICAEFSSGVFLIQTTSLSFNHAIYVTCMLIGFGGLCVHMQIYAMTQFEKPRYLTFFSVRIIQALLSTLLFGLFYSLIV